MASEILCGRCGAPLSSPSATCTKCGSGPSAGAFHRRGVPAKSPLLAAGLALIPGMGHVYLGHHLKGLFFLLACGGLEFLGVDFDLTVIGATLGIPLGLGGFGLYGYQIWDAYRQAKRLEQAAV